MIDCLEESAERVAEEMEKRLSREMQWPSMKRQKAYKQFFGPYVLDLFLTTEKEDDDD